MLKKKVSNKAFAIMLTIVISLFGSVCFGALQWTYLMETSNGLNKTTTTLGKQALSCYGTTLVETYYGAGVRVLLQTIDEEGDWATVTGWTDFHEDFAGLSETYAVSDGTYRLQVQHTAYAEGDTDFSEPLETHYSYSSIQIYGTQP